MVESPPLVLSHPRLPGITLHRSPRPGKHHLLAVGVELGGQDLVDVGDWLGQLGREELDAAER
ncbi:hypothetical protein [Nonomuraea rubra]|uniref:hypothetical protein n=1 Tax=Nonomuraea rubra TaxID=46180 RepID=UPI0033D50CC0